MTKNLLGMYFWFGSATYGARFGRYYGFNLFDRVGAHYNTRGEVSLQIGSWLKFWEF